MRGRGRGEDDVGGVVRRDGGVGIEDGVWGLGDEAPSATESHCNALHCMIAIGLRGMAY